MKTGFGLCCLGIIIMSVATMTLGPLAFKDMMNPCADWWLEIESSNYELQKMCGKLDV